MTYALVMIIGKSFLPQIETAHRSSSRNMKLSNKFALLVAGFLSWSAVSGSASGDVVTQWNEVFLKAVRNETTPPPLAARNLAILHTAIYDAVNAITRTHQPYCLKTKASKEASMEAAASTAAHRVSVHLYPSRRAEFDTLLTNSLCCITNGESKTNGMHVGAEAAEAILALRQNDGASTTVPYISSKEPGRWQRTPPHFRPPELPAWRFLKPFAMTNNTQFRPSPPPALNSHRYADDVNEVKRLGERSSKERTPEQTQIARFWSDFSYTVTPPGHWNDIARRITLPRKTPLEDNARLFALLNIALTDAAIIAWEAKYAYDYWRPVTAIQQGDLDGNDATQPQRDWESFLVTPPFPEYPSGHSTFSGAAAAVISDFLGTDEIAFAVGCDALPDVERKFHSLKAAAEEVGRSRIYGGIHFRTADENGRQIGKTLGEFVAEHFLRPQE